MKKWYVQKLHTPIHMVLYPGKLKQISSKYTISMSSFLSAIASSPSAALNSAFGQMLW